MATEALAAPEKMIIDAHLHCSGRENSSEILHALDQAGVEKAVLLAPFLGNGYSLGSSESVARANRHLAQLVNAGRDRLVGFGVLNPMLDSTPDDLALIRDLGLVGLKLAPSGWYPYDDCAHQIYESAAEWGMPILFHSGIFIDGKSGRFCRPAFYEIVRNYPRLRVTLAHLGWPWTDEAIAVGLIDLINGVDADESQFRFDISFGPPPIYRQDILEKALAVLTPALLQFGSDRILPCSGAHIREKIDEVADLLNSLKVDQTARDRIMRGTAAAWLNK